MSDKRIQPILERRSVRAFNGENISENDINTLLEAAMAAPSACCRDPWEFIVLTDREALAKAANALPNGKFLADAACGILVCGAEKDAHAQSLSYLLQDCSAAIENILIAARAIGYGTCWLGVHPRMERIEELRAAFAIPAETLVIGAVAVGKCNEFPESRSRFNVAKVHKNRW